MEVTHLLVVCLLVGPSALSVRAEKKAEVGEVTEAPITEDQKKVYAECRNPDYKKYVKCLMRPKRHHGHHANHGDELPETDPTHCLESCLKKCHDHHLDHECEKKCSYCTKRTRHRHQIITEYETECVSGNCNAANNGQLRTTNITTNIGIHNVINPFGGGNDSAWNIFNKTGGCCPPGKLPCYPGIPPCYPGSVPGSISGSTLGVSSIPIVPQISLVPQITYGVGFGAAGGCAYNQWLCIQQTGIQGVQLPNVPDCSGCGNPFLRYKCDVNCYATYANTATKSPCTTPECVGGSK